MSTADLDVEGPDTFIAWTMTRDFAVPTTPEEGLYTLKRGVQLPDRPCIRRSGVGSAWLGSALLAPPFGDKTQPPAAFSSMLMPLRPDREKVTKGCSPPANTKFCPNNHVTRGQMAAFLHRALD
jgi:hypothetical protein